MNRRRKPRPILDPFALFRLPLWALRFWVRLLGARVVWIGIGVVSFVVCLYGWYETWG